MKARMATEESIEYEMNEELTLNLHAEITPYSLVNGPGLRTVIHFQGCSLGCLGCFNPMSHPSDEGIRLTIKDVNNRIPDDVEGITISGGEPFQQAEGLYMLTKTAQRRGDSVIVFSGYSLDELIQKPLNREILKNIDVLIDGRFDSTRIAKNGLRGSANQVIHLLTDRYQTHQLDVRQTEINFDKGKITMLGFPSGEIRRLLR